MRKSGAIRREMVLLLRHIEEGRELWKGVLGSLVVVVALWVVGRLLPLVIPHLPAALTPWLSGSHLTVMGIALLIILVQYLGWRKQYLANHPEIDERLLRRLREVIPNLSENAQGILRQLAEQEIVMDAQSPELEELLQNGFVKPAYKYAPHTMLADGLYMLAEDYEAAVKAYFSTLAPPPASPPSPMASG